MSSTAYASQSEKIETKDQIDAQFVYQEECSVLFQDSVCTNQQTFKDLVKAYNYRKKDDSFYLDSELNALSFNWGDFAIGVGVGFSIATVTYIIIKYK